MISLTGKAALITGGSRGIGASTVKMFAQAGADVVFSYRAAAKRPPKWGGGGQARHARGILQGRLRQNERCEKTDRIMTAAGAAGDILWRMPGSGARRPAHPEAQGKRLGRNAPREFEEHVCDHAIVGPNMIAQRGGRIITMSSIPGSAARVSHPLSRPPKAQSSASRRGSRRSWPGTISW